ncbi:Uncharacterised protein [Shigella sonnei]|nr:Uncharacterised protein [Shigella sonnei]
MDIQSISDNSMGNFKQNEDIMLVENINTTLTGNNKKNEPHDKGWGILEQGTIALVVLFVIVVVLGSLYALRTRTNVATETANIQTLSQVPRAC